MKKVCTPIILFWAFLFMLSNQLKAQLNYLPGGFSTSIATYTDIGTSGTAISVSDADDGFSAALPIGFMFNFNGATYDSFTFSTNGFIKLGRDTASRQFLFTTQAQPPANGPFTAATSPAPLGRDSSFIFAFGQDIFPLNPSDAYRYEVSGFPGTQICTIQWKNVRDKLQGGVAGLWDTINFQIKLFEGTNVIEIVYGKWTSTSNINAARFSAVGLVGNSMTIANQNLHLVKGSTVAWSGAVANTGFYLNNAVNYRNPTSTPAGPAPELGRTYTFTPLMLNDASVRAVYAQGKVALPYYRPDSIRANIANTGINTLTGLVVTLTISGANTYTTSATITSLAPNANTNVSFAPYLPTNLGASLITVSVPADDNPANNNRNYSFSVGEHVQSYIDTLVPSSGGNGTTIPNFWGSKYFIEGSGMVTQVRSLLASNSEAANDTVCGLVLDSTGRVLARSPNYIVQTSDLGTTLVFNMTMPAVVTNQSVIVGIAGGQSVDGLNYFLGTSQTETPIRPDVQFYFMTQTFPGGVTSLNVGNVYANPVGWGTTRLMMECKVDPLPPIDVGISASGPNAAVKVPTNVSIPLRAVVRNFGTQLRSSGIQVRYQVNGGAVVGPVSTAVALNPGDTTSVVFAGTAALNFGSAGNFTVKIFTSLAGDGLIGNDTLTVVFQAQAAQTLPYLQANNLLSTFTTLNNTPAIWKQGTAMQANGVSNSLVTFADNISTTNGREAWLLSPPISLVGSANPVLHFQVAHGPNTFAGTDDTLEVLVSTDGGLNYTSLYLKSSQLSIPALGSDTPSALFYTPNFSQDWRYESVNLSLFAGAPYITLAFKNKSGSGNSIYIGGLSVANVANINTQSVSFASSFYNAELSVTFSSIGNTAGGISMSRHSSAPFTSASPVFASNTNATSNNSSIFTPSNASITHWYSLAYSGIGVGNYSPSVSYSVNIDITNIPGISSVDSLYIIRRSDFSGSWQAVSTSISGVNLYTGLISGFGDIGIGSIPSRNALPVSWLAFTGKIVNEQKNELNWQTSQEMNADYFELEFGSDPNNFVPVGKLKAAGNSNTIQQYTMAHAHQEQGLNTFYYRVKQVDTDGKYSYSKTITLSNEITQVNKPEISVINPFSGAIKFGLNQTDFSEISIRVLDNQGRVVYANSREANAGFSMHELPETATLANGLYYIEISKLGAPILLQKLIKVTE
ncbi:MAG: hypothetical protein Q8R57_04815 [Bacteroidota bacterium]|nr:hypothetical protein [Bacteroidota bacterium]